MAEVFSGSIVVSVSAKLASDIDIGTRSHVVNTSKTINFTNGVGANQANNMWVDTRTVASETVDSLDLSGVLLNAFGTTLLFTKIKAMIITPAEANTANLILGGAASNAFVAWVGDSTDTLILKPGCPLVLIANDAAGYAVTAGTADILAVENESLSSQSYEIILFGCV